MKSVTRLLAVTTLLVFASESAAVYTVNGQRKSFEIFRAEAAPVIDGRLDDDVWRYAAVVDDFHQTQPTDGATPTELTVDESNHLHSIENELNVKLACTLRY